MIESIIAAILSGGSIMTFILSYLIFNGISEGGGINWEAVFVSVVAATCFASFVLSFVNNLFIIAFVITAFIFTYMEFGA